MKTFLSIILSLILFIIGASSQLLVFGIVEWVAIKAHEGFGFLRLLHYFLALVIASGFGGFLGLYITPKKFQDVNKIYVFRGLIFILAVFSIKSILMIILDNKSCIIPFISSAISIGCIIIGAKLGKSMYEEAKTCKVIETN